MSSEEKEKLALALHKIAEALENIRLGDKAMNYDLEQEIETVARYFGG